MGMLYPCWSSVIHTQSSNIGHAQSYIPAICLVIWAMTAQENCLIKSIQCHVISFFRIQDDVVWKQAVNDVFYSLPLRLKIMLGAYTLLSLVLVESSMNIKIYINLWHGAPHVMLHPSPSLYSHLVSHWISSMLWGLRICHWDLNGYLIVSFEKNITIKFCKSLVDSCRQSIRNIIALFYQLIYISLSLPTF